MTEEQRSVQKRAENAAALMPRNIADAVTSRVQKLTTAGELHLPENYSAPNALKAAWLAIQNSESRDKLMNCTGESVAEALLDMIVQGLNPAKDQCYFVPFGKRCVCMRSYIGTIALLKRIYGQKSRVFPVLVYDGDQVTKARDRGRLKITAHEIGDNDGNDDKIVAAYCIVEPEGEEPHTEWMTIEQIRACWKQGAANGASPAHKKFAGEMAKKTVTNRACKVLIKSSDDSYLAEAMERQELLAAEASMDAEVAEHANQDVVDIDGSDETAAVEISPQQANERIEQARQNTTVTTSDDAADEETSQGGDEPEDPESESDHSPEEESAASPASRFQDLIDGHELQATKARQLVAKINDLDDARKVTNDMLAEVVHDGDSMQQFLEMYADEHGQRELAGAGKGPGW